VRSPCLCPRPETEELVEHAAADIRRILRSMDLIDKADLMSSGESNPDSRRKIRVLDIGCGTGAIGLALASEFPGRLQVVAIDILDEAINLSRENASILLPPREEYVALRASAANFGLGVKKKGVDVAQNVYKYGVDIDTDNDIDISKSIDMFDIVVSNPPYIPADEIPHLTQDVLAYEDLGALCGGLDGMDIVKDIVRGLARWWRNDRDKGGDNLGIKPLPAPTCLMEVDPTHPDLLRSWIDEEEEIKEFVELDNIKRDMQGNLRFITLRQRSTKSDS